MPLDLLPIESFSKAWLSQFLERNHSSRVGSRGRMHYPAGLAGYRRLWLVTTNDNTHALRFYQHRGFRIAAIYPVAVDAYRRGLKPEIGLTGNDGIPISDEIELEVVLA